MKFDVKDFERFKKQIILKKIGFSGQKKIRNAKILIIGMGGLGCPLLTYLSSSGVCNIGIVDHDKVELSNLNRQILFDTSDIGKFNGNTIYKGLWDKKKKKYSRISHIEAGITKTPLQEISEDFIEHGYELDDISWKSNDTVIRITFN